MQIQIHELEVLAQSNSVLTSLNTTVMVQLVQITVTMNDMQEQLKMLVVIPERKR